MAEKTTVLIVAHGHPDTDKGGGELAAYAHYRELAARPDIDAYFMARAPAQAGHGGTPFSLRNGGREVLWHSDMPDHFRFSQPNKHIVWHAFREFLATIRPHVVHFHHYLHIGIELLQEVKRFDPATRLVLTLHDYWAICHQHGQMVKTNPAIALCERAVPADCARCFPQYSPGDFFLRELFIKSYFDLVDVFVAPSEFLRQRYIAWGIAPERIVTLENGQPPVTPPPPRPLADGEPRSRFAFFGQINPYKGVDVLVEAIERLPVSTRKKIRIEIHGANLHLQTEAFRDRILAQIEANKRYVCLAGSYRPDQLGRLMANTDWVVVPSVWWENSPLVIQEAFSHRRPVICSDIGGMAEKVRHGVDGLHFRAGNAVDLARRLQEAIETPGLWERLYAQIPTPPSIDTTVDRLLMLYRTPELRPTT